MLKELRVLICAERYRTKEQTYDTDDFLVDGVKLFRLPVLVDTDIPFEKIAEQLKAEFKEPLVQFVTDVREGKHSDHFPKFTQHLLADGVFWFHVTTDCALADRPKEFHTQGFSEAELLGLPADEQPDPLSTLSLYISSSGEPLDGPPDKFMLSIGAA